MLAHFYIPLFGTPEPPPPSAELRPIRLSSIIAPRIELGSAIVAGIALDSPIADAD